MMAFAPVFKAFQRSSAFPYVRNKTVLRDEVTKYFPEGDFRRI
jgi:hypothetical protein